MKGCKPPRTVCSPFFYNTKEAAMTPEEKEQARQARNEYLRQWRKKNPQKTQEYMSRYWLKKFEEGITKK